MEYKRFTVFYFRKRFKNVWSFFDTKAQRHQGTKFFIKKWDNNWMMLQTIKRFKPLNKRSELNLSLYSTQLLFLKSTSGNTLF